MHKTVVDVLKLILKKCPPAPPPQKNPQIIPFYEEHNLNDFSLLKKYITIEFRFMLKGRKRELGGEKRLM